MVDKNDVIAAKPNTNELIRVANGEDVTAETENQNNSLLLTALILLFNFIEDSGVDTSANTFTGAQTFEGGIFTNTITNQEDNNQNIIVVTNNGSLYRNSESDPDNEYITRGTATTVLTATEAARDAAVVAQTAAETASTNAATSETNAATSASNASSDATAAGTSETNAAASATAAAASAASITGDVAAAEAARDAAVTARTGAETAETNAAASATAAAGSEASALSHRNSASTSATQASTSSTQAATSATNASNAQTAAETARDKAQDWAEENEDVAVEPGQFSAKHYAAKAAAAGGNVPAGGAADQVLTKIDGTDYNTEWRDGGGSDLYTMTFPFVSGQWNAGAGSSGTAPLTFNYSNFTANANSHYSLYAGQFSGELFEGAGNQVVFNCGIQLMNAFGDSATTKVRMMLTDATDIQDNNLYGFGIEIDAGDIYSTWGNGGARQRALSDEDVIEGFNLQTFRCVYTVGTDIKFYVGNTLIRTQTAGLPSSFSNSLRVLVGVESTTSASRSAWILAPTVQFSHRSI